MSVYTRFMDDLKDKELDTMGRKVARTCLGGNLRRVSRTVAKAYDDALRPSGMRGTQFNLLTAILLMRPVAISKLAEVLAMDRTTLTRNLGPLQKRGLVDISPGNDQRVRVVTMTDEGIRMYRHALPLWARAQEEVESKLGQALAQSLLSDLKAAAKRVG